MGKFEEIAERRTDRIKGLEKEVSRLEAENQKLKDDRFARFANEECWIYQGNEEDHLESLVCPVVIWPHVLIALKAENAEFKQDIKRLRAVNQLRLNI